jgi:guanylate kinase
MLSAEISARLNKAAIQEQQYVPNTVVAAQLQSKNFVMFVGPVAVGKSFLMNHILGQASDFGRVAVFTTRDARPDDEPGMFRYYPHDNEHIGQLLNKIEAGEAVQYAVHPTSGRIYGSEITDYEKPYSMLATLSGIVNHLRKLPFASTHIVGLAVQPDVWLERLHTRYPVASDERTKRLKEAVNALEWLLDSTNQAHITWVDNTPRDAAPAVQSVINAIKYNTHNSSAAREVAVAMLNRLKEGIS